MYEKNLIYALANTKTRKIYVGRTSTTMMKRWQCHRQAIKVMEHRNLYKYMWRRCIDNWMIIPLELCTVEKTWDKGKTHRYMDWKESMWINKYRNWVLNCPNSIKSGNLSKEFKKRKNYRNYRLEKMCKEKRRRRNDMYRILQDKVDLDKESDEVLLSIMIDIKKLTMEKNQRKKIERLVSKVLRKRGISLAKKQFISVPNINEKTKKEIREYLTKVLQSKYKRKVATYIMNKVKISSGKVKNILQILQYSNRFDSKNSTCICWKFVYKNEEGKHACIRAQELDIEHDRLKSILVRNSNTRVEVSDIHWKKINM